jgi:hypothetical protein
MIHSSLTPLESAATRFGDSVSNVTTMAERLLGIAQWTGEKSHAGLVHDSRRAGSPVIISPGV